MAKRCQLQVQHVHLLLRLRAHPIHGRRPLGQPVETILLALELHLKSFLGQWVQWAY